VHGPDERMLGLAVIFAAGFFGPRIIASATAGMPEITSAAHVTNAPSPIANFLREKLSVEAGSRREGWMNCVRADPNDDNVARSQFLLLDLTRTVLHDRSSACGLEGADAVTIVLVQLDSWSHQPIRKIRMSMPRSLKSPVPRASKPSSTSESGEATSAKYLCEQFVDLRDGKVHRGVADVEFEAL
jgi:hypothetical protein